MNSSILLFLTLIVMILLVYIQFYNKFNKEYQIIQTEVDKVDLDMLYEKNPILIYEPLTRPKELLSTLFKYSYITKNEYQIDTHNIYLNNCKFSIVYSDNTQDETYVNIINPIYKNKLKFKKLKNGHLISKIAFQDANEVQYITLKLRTNQVLLLPSHWMIQTTNIVQKIDMDDVFSLIFFKFKRIF